MASIVAYSGLSYWINWGGVPWSDSDTAALSPGEYTYGRGFEFTAQFAEIHDGCVIDSITIAFTGDVSSIYGEQKCIVSWAGLSLIAYPTTTPAEYSVTKNSAEVAAAGITPAFLRSTTELTSSVYNEDIFYPVTTNMSLPVVTVTYTDNGTPHTLFFGSNF